MTLADSTAGQGASICRPLRRNGWYEASGPEGYVLSRHWPPRFDISARTHLPKADRRRLALQVRQDLWRALKDLRGFSPVVQLRTYDHGLDLVAGGRLMAAAPAGTQARVSTLLDDPAYRERWMAWAKGRSS